MSWLHNLVVADITAAEERHHGAERSTLSELTNSACGNTVKALPHLLMKCPAGCFCVFAAVRKFLSVGGATGARSTASEPVQKKLAGNDKGRLADAIRQPPVVAPCTPIEIAVTVPECGA